MRKLQHFICLLLLITTPIFLTAYPNPLPKISPVQKVSLEKIKVSDNHALSYDEILRLLDGIETDELEKKCTFEELEKVKHFVAFLAWQGTLPDDSDTSLSIDEDIEDLLHGENPFYSDHFSFVIPSEYPYMIVLAVLNSPNDVILCKSWIHKKWDQVKKFCKKHKKEILVGAAIAVAAAVVIVAVTAAVSGAAGTAAAGAAGAAASSHSDTKEQKKDLASMASVEVPSEMITHEAPLLKSVIDHQISSFKENIVQEQFFQSADTASQNKRIFWEENGRTLGSLFAHYSFNYLQDQIPCDPALAQEIQEIRSKDIFSFPEASDNGQIGHIEIDRRFSTDLIHLFTTSQLPDFNILSYHVRGENALAHGHYSQAVEDFGKAIELGFNHPSAHLERGMANFGLGKYDNALADYQQFTSQMQKTESFPVLEFSSGFAKGLPQGIYDSGRGIFVFLSDIVTRPIQTGKQMWDALKLLSDLAHSSQWEALSEVLVPEVHQLIKEWDIIASDQRGELAGYAFGKYGSDILIPGVLAKAVAQGLGSVKELSTVYRGLKTTEQTFFLESVANLENSAKIAEVVQLEKQISEWLGEGARLIRNEAGDPVFLSKDGLRCIRFDFNRAHPHGNPHAHAEIKVDGQWIKSGQIYPIDVPHN